MPDELPCAGSEVVRARRLFSGSRHAAARLLIDVPADVLPCKRGRACGLADCLDSALQLCSVSPGYAELMGLTNAACMLRVDDRLSLDSTKEDRWYRVVPVLERLGFGRARLHAGPDATEVVEGELRGGRPLLALGWGEESRDWALICGQSADREKWWGYHFDSRPILEEAIGACRLLLSLGPQTCEPDLAQVRRDGLSAAAILPDSQRDPIPQYHRWMEMMRSKSAIAEPQQRLSVIRRHEWMVEVLLDARTAAADFLQMLSEDEPDEAGLLQVSDTYLQIVDILEARDPLWYTEHGSLLLESAEERAVWAELLDEAMRMERHALSLLSAVGGRGR